MFVYLQKDTKQHCDAIELDCAHSAGSLTMLVIVTVIVDKFNEYHPALRAHIIVWRCFWSSGEDWTALLCSGVRSNPGPDNLPKTRLGPVHQLQTACPKIV